MASARLSSLADSSAGVKLLLIGVGVILAAQWWNAVPIATAIALAGWGTSLTAPRRRWVIVLTAVVYAALGIVTIASQVDLAMNASFAWAALAAVDGAVAFMLIYSLSCQAGELLASAWD